ncbi:hypothetical protein NDU88_002761 [Pleurodeles waltl]|uniref:Uncharacterized protein n=1 Tax=Pleurodeles waltl TaxID=8319 RepID=A0AAV7RCZ8_PLEWA|nr:hypothetical protein NDU88_002761 [Pleurodeles waltl]
MPKRRPRLSGRWRGRLSCEHTRQEVTISTGTDDDTAPWQRSEDRDSTRYVGPQRSVRGWAVGLGPHRRTVTSAHKVDNSSPRRDYSTRMTEPRPPPGEDRKGESVSTCPQCPVEIRTVGQPGKWDCHPLEE